ncbi:Lrp/AsnC family transcriptional regulator (plasmid) [Mesorhizobium sp. AR07]|uniref:Lrp/AsnC family transcriptional regulator n=1 Tax=Mesorhizobium sp. AR07 TaxID=2865838 RepID=UPI00215EBF87|nr:Lrp/AsnC family transcriptional regulator [Mesorhizobium sp. AR07]UVK49017.1 Lrp/AsnC family transcriptional regulator [Mesorhizobium sp. AR07]
MRSSIDPYDLKILSALQRDGRTTMSRLAETVGLSASPCHARVQRLIKDGVLGPFRPDVRIDKLTYSLTVIVPVELKQHESKNFTAFERAISTIPEIVECYAVGGGFDYVLKVITKDIESFQSLMDGLLEKEIGIAKYYSYIVTKTIRRFTGFPLEKLLHDSG